MPAPLQALTRVELALARLNLLNKPCDYIRTVTGMEVLHTTDNGFNAWVRKLEKLPIKSPRHLKRKLKIRRNDKSLQNSIYYENKKTKKAKITVDK